MEITELLEIISRGEDSKHQFKGDVTNVISLAQEMVAFSNSGGGKIFIGVSDTGEITGLSSTDMNRLNGLVSNAASQHVRPPINPQTENIALPKGLVMVITVLDGISKPYSDKDGVFWVKSGADKRKATFREEIQRLFQQAGLIHGDEIVINNMTVADVDIPYFIEFFEKNNKIRLDDQKNSIPVILENMNLMKNGSMNVSGALLFAKNPQLKLPVFIVKAICFPGNEIDAKTYIESVDITGKMEEVFRAGKSFMLRNIMKVQGGQNINSLGVLEIPEIAIEELLVNALIHRDYFISSHIRIFIFKNRIEIISPGHLPNNLTVENIKNGNSNIRNPILSSFATKILPYRGIGTGVQRALTEYPDIDFENDLDGNQFKVIIERRA
ncbi:MAG: ATP-dependent DNA helicase RecG [Candidatus Hydrogenedentes bacterium CG07_land_8_20_14_0_80_42_17]|nr:MAG: ATP-dependent DNA helicase RecG [Candidatus Hydrogenedentes bacterium CG07_land_8_20_14_0_80_42_17]